MKYRYAASADAPALAALFAAGHHDALSDQQRAEQGFVQGNLDVETLRGMAAARSLLLADQDDRVAGFLGLSVAADMPAPPPPIKALLEAQDSLRWQDTPLSAIRWLLYGPVLVDPAFRGRGVARGLYAMAMDAAATRAELVVAFIESTNRPSWHVHVDGFGMTPLGDFTAAGRSYHVVASPPES